MKRIAITGGIACGKTQVGSILEAEGVQVCEADELARGLMQPGEAVFLDVVEAFGTEILLPDGQIDRRALGRLIVGDSEERERLNACVHPETRVQWMAWLDRQAAAPEAVVIIPLLYEVEDASGWDSVICVAAPRGMQIERLTARGLTAEEATKWIAAQIDVAEKVQRADFVIANSGSVELLRQQTLRVLKCIRER